MSYVQTEGVLDDLLGLAAKGGQALGQRYGGQVYTAAKAVGLILEDPALPRVANRIGELNRLERARAKAPAGAKVGIGLRRLERPLDLYIQFRRNPMLGWLALGVAVGVPVLIGYAIAKR